MSQTVRHARNLYVTNSAIKGANTIPAVADKAINVFNEAGAEATGSDTKFRVVQGRAEGNQLISDLIDVSKITSATKTTGVAATEQSYTIGYNGSAGSIDAINDNLYIVRLYWEELLVSSSDGRQVSHGTYNSDATATQAEVAKGIAESLMLNVSKDPERKIQVSRLNSGTSVANTGTGDLTVTYGSKTISAATDIDAVASVGDLVRFGTTTDAPVYEIASINAGANTAELDMAYQGASGTVAAADYRFVTTVGADWGVNVVGLPLDYRYGRIRYTQVIFSPTLQGFGTTTETTVANPNPGVNTGKLVADIEQFTRSFQGEEFEVGSPNLFINETNVALGSFYTMYTIEYVDDSYTGIGAPSHSRKQVQIAIPQSGSGSVATGTLVTVLDAILP